MSRITRPALIAALLALVTLATYAQVRGFEFVALDDNVYVSDNPVVIAGLSTDGVGWALTTFEQGNWHPLTWLSHMLDAEIGGVDPAAHHLASLVLHVVNALLLFALLLRATDRPWPCAFVAGLFALHPLNVESVAWVAERKTVLCMTFGLLSALAYLAYAKRGGAPRYLGALLLMALGLMSKPMLVTLPLAFLLLDYWPLSRLRTATIRSLVLEKLPFLLLAAGSSAVTLKAQSAGGALVGATGNLSAGPRLANALVSYARYLRKLFWPDDLAVLYQHPNAPGGTPWTPGQIGGAALLLAGITLAVWLLRERRYLTVGWLWFLGTMVPMIGIVQVGEQGMADRYAYLPMIGLLLALVWGLADLVRKIVPDTRVALAIAGCLGTLALAGTALASHRQAGHWRDSITLFQRGLAFSPDSQTLNLNLGTALEARGRFDEALVHYRRALDVGSVNVNEHWGVASALRGQGLMDEALGHYQQALALDPANARLHHATGDALLLSGRHAEAVGHYEAALRVAPTLHGVRSSLGSALLRLGALDRAIARFGEAIELDPTRPEVHNNLAAALVRSGDARRALEHFGEAARLRPDWHVPWASSAHILVTHEDPAIRNPSEALRLAGRAVALSGEQDPWSLETLSMAQAATGDLAGALRTGERALELARRAGMGELVRDLGRRLDGYRASSGAVW